MGTLLLFFSLSFSLCGSARVQYTSSWINTAYRDKKTYYACLNEETILYQIILLGHCAPRPSKHVLFGSNQSCSIECAAPFCWNHLKTLICHSSCYACISSSNFPVSIGSSLSLSRLKRQLTAGNRYHEHGVGVSQVVRRSKKKHTHTTPRREGSSSRHQSVVQHRRVHDIH